MPSADYYIEQAAHHYKVAACASTPEGQEVYFRAGDRLAELAAIAKGLLPARLAGQEGEPR